MNFPATFTVGTRGFVTVLGPVERVYWGPGMTPCYAVRLSGTPELYFSEDTERLGNIGDRYFYRPSDHWFDNYLVLLVLLGGWGDQWYGQEEAK